MRTIRVFPRRTKATPDDDLAFVGEPTLFAEADEVHISVSFTWDIPEAERLEKAWRNIAPTEIGGPAIGTKGDYFFPGKYLKRGYVITSRGCPNRCWFCSVWKRDGEIRELPITEGWIIQDDNLLACSDDHIRCVFAMLKRQPHKSEFTGGLEAARLRPWIVEELKSLCPKSVFFAYDTPNDLEPLRQAGELLKEAGFLIGSHNLRCYVLCGYPNDSFDRAEARFRQASEAGFFPFAMLWKKDDGKSDIEWRRFQREWTRPEIIATNLKEPKC